jgi:hypothetical protein
MVISEYDRQVDEFGFQVIDATQAIPVQQRLVRAVVAKKLGIPEAGDEIM